MLRFIHKDIVPVIYKELYFLKFKDVLDEYNRYEYIVYHYEKTYNWRGLGKYAPNTSFYTDIHDMLVGGGYKRGVLPKRYEYTCIKSDFVD